MMSQLITPIPSPTARTEEHGVSVCCPACVSRKGAIGANPGRYSSSHSTSPPNLGEEFNSLCNKVFVHDMLQKCYPNFLYDGRFYDHFYIQM